MRAMLLLAVLSLIPACSSSKDFACNACTSDEGCVGGQSCRLGYCVGAGDDPHRCPALQGATGASSGSDSGSSSASSSSSSSGTASSTASSASSSSGSTSSGTSSATSSSGSGSIASSSSSTGSTASSSSSTGSTSSGSTSAGSTSSGSTSSGSGSGSTGGCSGTSPTDAAFIDDLEDGDNTVLPNGGRNGVWFTYTDQSGGTLFPPENGTFTPSAGGANGSCFAADLIGSGFSSYAGMAFAFQVDTTAGSPLPYDGSAFSGLRFQARMAAGNPGMILYVRDQQAFNSSGASPSKYLQLSSTWTTYTVPWSQLTGATLDPSQLMIVTFQPLDVTDSFDLEVDDVEFVP